MSACHIRLSMRSSSSSSLDSEVAGEAGEAGAVLKLAGLEPLLPARRSCGRPGRAGRAGRGVPSEPPGAGSSSTVGGVGGRGLAPCAIATSNDGGGELGMGCNGCDGCSFSKRGGRRAFDGEWKGNGGGGSAASGMSSWGSGCQRLTHGETLTLPDISAAHTLAPPDHGAALLVRSHLARRRGRGLNDAPPPPPSGLRLGVRQRAFRPRVPGAVDGEFVQPGHGASRAVVRVQWRAVRERAPRSSARHQTRRRDEVGSVLPILSRGDIVTPPRGRGGRGAYRRRGQQAGSVVPAPAAEGGGGGTPHIVRGQD